MNRGLILITRRKNSWEVLITDGRVESIDVDVSLQNLYQTIYPKIISLYNRGFKINWYVHFLESGYFLINKGKKSEIREEIIKKYNYNVDKIKIIDYPVKRKNQIIHHFFSVNKEDYSDIKDFLKLFNYKLKDEMLFNIDYGINHGYENGLILYKLGTNLVSYMYQDNELRFINNFDNSVSSDLFNKLLINYSLTYIDLFTTTNVEEIPGICQEKINLRKMAI